MASLYAAGVYLTLIEDIDRAATWPERSDPIDEFFGLNLWNKRRPSRGLNRHSGCFGVLPLGEASFLGVSPPRPVSLFLRVR